MTGETPITRADGRRLHGVVAEFATPEAILDAAAKTRHAHYTRVRAYTPFPVEGLAETLGFRFNLLAPLVFLAGIGGAGLGYFMMWYANVVSYPLNVGGRPFHSWPSFIPITFELGVLSASLTAFVGTFLFSGLPRLHHPIFSAPYIGKMTAGRFFLCIEADDPAFDEQWTRRFLESLNPVEVHDVWD